MTEEKQKELIRYILQYMLSRYFMTKTRMAKALNVELRTIQKTFSQLEKNSSKGGSIVLEKVLVYCTQNGISVDEVMASYNESKEATVSDRRYVNFPIPQELDERVTDVYHHANEYVQCVASHLCPHCKRECKPMQGDKWLWNDCLVSRISMIMLSHILLAQDEVKAHESEKHFAATERTCK